MVNYISEFRDARLNSVYNAYLKRYSYKGNQTYNSYDLLLKNTPWKKGANLKLEVYRINNDSGIVKIQENKIKNSKELHLKGNFNTPDVLLLKLVRI